MLVRIVFTILFLLFVFTQVDVNKVIEDMKQANLIYVSLAVLFFMLALVANAFKWGV